MIPSVALVIAYLGDRLRKISRKAQIASASLSAYLNEVFSSDSSVLFFRLFHFEHLHLVFFFFFLFVNGKVTKAELLFLGPSCDFVCKG